MPKHPNKRSRKTPGEAHVRLYRHELECPAYRTLSPGARVLLIELRSLFDVTRGDNRVFCGIRRMMERCNLTQRAATRARDELVAKGWVKITQLGGFNCKLRHATEYALENEPPNTGNGSRPGKAFMRWQPTATPAVTGTTKNHGSRIDYRTVAESTTDEIQSGQKAAATVADSTIEKPGSEPFAVVESTTQIGLPPEGGFCSGPSASDPGIAEFRRAPRKRKQNVTPLRGGTVPPQWP